MSKSENVTFAVAGSNSFHKIELSRSLLRFVEFDFTYFWEQCIETGRNARKTGRISSKLENMAINSIIKCHPYVEACASTEFSSVVLDCIIAYICHSEGIGLEELWARCISPKSLYEKAIFTRVSEYKTGRGINQWINIVRMQEYARSKLRFIYENESNVMVRPQEYRTRTQYFDLAFAVAANETGCPMDKLPSVKKFTPAQLPDAVFMLGRMSKNIYRRLADVLGESEPWEKKELNDHNRDQTALDAFSYVKDMPRPAQIDMNFALEAVAGLPDTVYMPDSFKAMIDLEFTLMAENNIYMSKCPRCGRFFVRAAEEKNPYCRRVNSSGKTCSELMDEELGIASGSAAPAEDKPAEVVYQPAFDDILPAEEGADKPADEPAPEKAPEQTPAQAPAWMPASKPEEPAPIPVEIPKEVEKRCQKVYNMLYKRIGRIMTDSEFREWSKFLSDMKRDVRVGDAELGQLEDFLLYWETAVKKQSAKSKRHGGKEINDNIPIVDSIDYDKPAPENGLGDIFNEVMKVSDENESSGLSPAGTEAAPEEREFKPFNPPKYSTVLEAMLDGKYKSEELLKESAEDNPDISDIRVNGKKVTLPNWEKITKE